MPWLLVESGAHGICDAESVGYRIQRVELAMVWVCDEKEQLAVSNMQLAKNRGDSRSSTS